jgi:ubiquitin
MSLTLLHPREQRTVSVHRLIDECTLFKNNLGLLGAPYAIKSRASIEVFREFVSALNGEAIEITNVNFSGLSLLCTEFGFGSLFAQLSAFRSSGAFSGGTAESEALGRLAVLEQRVLERDHETAALRAELGRLSAAFESGRADHARLESAVDSLRAEVAALTARLAEAVNPRSARAAPASPAKPPSAARFSPPRSPANAASPPPAATIAPANVSPDRPCRHICVKTRAGRSLTVDVEPTDRIENVKAKVQDREGTPVDQQRFTYAGRELEDGRTLQEYCIPEHATFHLKGDMRG